MSCPIDKMPVEKVRQLLGEQFIDCSDEQIIELRDRLELLAEITVRSFLNQKSPHKLPQK